MGIPREFPFQEWRFLGIPRNSHTGEVYWLYRVDFIYRGYCFLYREVPLHCATKKSLLAASKPEENGR